VSDQETMSTTYATRVGERLRVVRKQKRMSLQAVESASQHEFKASVLGAYERGERAISVPRLQRLARFYNVPVDQLLPRDLGPEGPSWATGDGDTIDLRDENGSAAVSRPDDGRVSLDLGKLESLAAPERELLNRYIGMIQLQRQDFNGQVLTIRQEDLRAIACLFEATPDSMRRRLDQLGLIQHTKL
jgi:transcriptional regulator with XRE-family HTH domain